MKISNFIIASAMAASLAACAQPGYGNYGGGYGGAGPKQTIGTVGGALAGVLAGSQIGSGSGRLWATGAGVLLGALAGNNIGRSLDRADQQYLSQASYRSFETGAPVRWNNPDSGNYGTVGSRSVLSDARWWLLPRNIPRLSISEAAPRTLMAQLAASRTGHGRYRTDNYLLKDQI